MAEQNYIEEFISAIKQEPDKKDNTYSGVVSRIDEKGKVWVYVAGSRTDTPTETTSSEVEPGDKVNVEWRNNRLYIVGNTSNPAAGTLRVTAVEKAADQAKAAAQSALHDAGVAREAAESAKADADTAKESATTAVQSANTALIQLATIEDVVGTVNWIAEHGAFELTQDTVVDPSKRYYQQNSDGSYEIYLIESGDPSDLGLYELSGIAEAVTNFISAHLALTTSGLWLTGDENSPYRLLMATDGLYIYGPQGVISKFGENVEFSSDKSQRIGGENSYIEFDSSTGRLNVVADDVFIGSSNAGEVIEAHQEQLTEMAGYVDINTEDSYIRVGKKGADSYVQIDGADAKVVINIDGRDVAYMSGARFYAPSAVVTNLYMKAELGGDELGEIGWVMRSNKHLSLKRLK